MARPKKCKIVDICLEHNEFVPNKDFEKIVAIFPEELQAIKLKDIDWLWVIEAGKKMWVSKSTFSNIYKTAHRKISQALIKWYKLVFKC